VSIQTVTLDEFATADADPDEWTSWQRHRLDIQLCETAREIFWDGRDRESYSCPTCGAEDTVFEVHHCDGDRLNNHPINLIAICKRCIETSTAAALRYSEYRR